MAALTTSTVEWLPSVVRHRNRRRVVRVLSELEGETTYAQVTEQLLPQLRDLELPPGVRWEMGGAYESSQEANGAIAAKAPFGALLLVAILLAEFNSFRRVFILLMTAPMAVLGIWPGLFLGGLSFGFVALLGAVALIGIVVNAAIVLVDVADRRREEGRTIPDAVEEAVRLRTRPILLTTATTVAGLMPLLFSRSTLWPPMAAAMISGLLVATILTLLAIPALYRLLVAGLPTGGSGEGESAEGGGQP
jgi:multidrug efflux pump subunit AcrB